jgi:hypothetical protein
MKPTWCRRFRPARVVTENGVGNRQPQPACQFTLFEFAITAIQRLNSDSAGRWLRRISARMRAESSVNENGLPKPKFQKKSAQILR